MLWTPPIKLYSAQLFWKWGRNLKYQTKTICMVLYKTGRQWEPILQKSPWARHRIPPSLRAADPEVWSPGAAWQFSALQGSIGIMTYYYCLPGAVTPAWLCLQGVEFHEATLCRLAASLNFCEKKNEKKKQQLDRQSNSCTLTQNICPAIKIYSCPRVTAQEQSLFFSNVFWDLLESRPTKW